MSRRGVGKRQRNAGDDAAEQARKARRTEAWRLRYEEGLDYHAIKDRLGVSLGTVANDLAAMRAEPADVSAYQALANARLEPVMDVMRDKALTGDTQAANALAGLQAQHAKINGYLAPEKRELSGPNGGPIDIKAAQDDLLGRIARLAEPGGKKPGDSEPEPV